MTNINVLLKIKTKGATE